MPEYKQFYMPPEIRVSDGAEMSKSDAALLKQDMVDLRSAVMEERKRLRTRCAMYGEFAPREVMDTYDRIIKVAGVNSQVLQEIEGQKKRELQEARQVRFERAFVEAARAVLSESDFCVLIAIATEQTNGANHADLEG